MHEPDPVVYLTEDLVVQIATLNLTQNGQGAAEVRDYGLLSSAVNRPRSVSFGVTHYPGLFDKAAALLQSLARNHAFVDGNKRAAWNSAAAFLEVNGAHLLEPLDEDRAEKFVLAVVSGELADVEAIAGVLATFHDPPAGEPGC
ncbi:MAG: type II toxin-antitoxin system death-on-curing family toxin [Nocardiopsaceae bacterium]|nr:type II toxin-antitoxin system death-on-curing family toxin [Nocardiopsaceae bacterium]